MADDIDELLGLLARHGENKRYRTQLLGWLLDRLKSASGAERAFLVSVTESNEYKIWCSRGSGGKQVPSARDCLSHHALTSALEEGAPTLFSNTLQDRRFRTASEAETGNRVHWIQLFPLASPLSSTAVYLDSRFALQDQAESSISTDEGLLELFRLLLLEDGNHVVAPASTTAQPVEEEPDEEANAMAAPIPSVKPVTFGSFVTRSTELIRHLDELHKVTRTEIPILISGESGTGKELLARVIHDESGRNGDFVTVHCGTINESLAEVEFFGHEKGAFTDAVEQRPGIFELAKGGTLFLDAIEEAPDSLQAMLLGVLQSGRYRRLAGEHDQEADVRIISSIGSQDPGDQVRSDLIYRLSGFQNSSATIREKDLKTSC